MRLFVAVDPSDAVLQALDRTIEALRPSAPEAKWVRPTGIHLTLAFLGEVADDAAPLVEGALAAVATRHAALDLEARGGGTFGGRRPRVLWVGLTGHLERLAALRHDVERALVPLGYEPEARDFRPHLTLARSREPRGDVALAACAEAIGDGSLGRFRVGELLLYQSHLSAAGATYTALARLPLATGG